MTSLNVQTSSLYFVNYESMCMSSFFLHLNLKIQSWYFILLFSDMITFVVYLMPKPSLLNRSATIWPIATEDKRDPFLKVFVRL